MIWGHHEVVLNGRGDQKNSLAEETTRLILEFESLTTIILDGISSSSLSRLSSPDTTTDDWGSGEPQTLSQQLPFVAQLTAFHVA